jgi:putative ABC transport system substrate-binding protein
MFVEKGSAMKKFNQSAFLIVMILVAVVVTAEAQQPNKTARIGYLAAAPPAAVSAWFDALRQRLREIGYVEGKNIIIEARYASGNLDQVPKLAAELVRLKVDVIVTGGPMDTRAAKEATNTIPIVMAFDSDPVANGFVASLAHPGGNITGLSTLAPELGGKRLEILKEVVPKLSRVAVFGDSAEPANAQALKEADLAAKALGLKLQNLDIKDPKDIEIAFRAAVKGRAQAVLVLTSPVTLTQRAQVVELAAKNRLPASYWSQDFVNDGGLMSYAANFGDMYRRAATFVDKILKGTKPADLPVEQPMKFEFIVNLKAAKQIGLTIPPNVLVRADRVIR